MFNVWIDPTSHKVLAETHAPGSVEFDGTIANQEVQNVDDTTGAMLGNCPQKCARHDMDPTTFAITHYPPVVVNANQGFINHLNTLTIASGSDADTLRQGVIDYLSGQPAVPAV